MIFAGAPLQMADAPRASRLRMVRLAIVSADKYVRRFQERLKAAAATNPKAACRLYPPAARARVGGLVPDDAITPLRQQDGRSRRSGPADRQAVCGHRTSAF